MNATPIVIERRARGVYQLHQGSFRFAAVLPNLGAAVTRAFVLVRLLGVELQYREKPGAAPVVLVGR